MPRIPRRSPCLSRHFLGSTRYAIPPQCARAKDSSWCTASPPDLHSTKLACSINRSYVYVPAPPILFRENADSDIVPVLRSRTRTTSPLLLSPTSVIWTTTVRWTRKVRPTSPPCFRHDANLSHADRGNHPRQAIRRGVHRNISETTYQRRRGVYGARSCYQAIQQGQSRSPPPLPSSNLTTLPCL